VSKVDVAEQKGENWIDHNSVGESPRKCFTQMLE